MGLTWVLSAPDGPHIGPMNLAIWGCIVMPWESLQPYCPLKHHTAYSMAVNSSSKMAVISQMTFSNAFSWMIMLELRFEFHRSLFPRHVMISEVLIQYKDCLSRCWHYNYKDTGKMTSLYWIRLYFIISQYLVSLVYHKTIAGPDHKSMGCLPEGLGDEKIAMT